MSTIVDFKKMGKNRPEKHLKRNKPAKIRKGKTSSDGQRYTHLLTINFKRMDLITCTLYELLPLFWSILAALIIIKIAGSKWFEKLFGK